MKIKYTVLMSVYYNEKPEYLTAAIESILVQTYPTDQIVIVEDGRLTKELYDVLDYYSQNYKGLIERLSLPYNLGLGKALDEGIKICRNEYIARMDSDDISVPFRCEKEIMFLEENPDVDIVSSNIAEFIDDPINIVSERVVPEKNEDIKKQMRRRSGFNHPVVMFKKSEVITCGGYGDIIRKEDHDLFSRMLNMGCKGYNIQEILLLYRIGKENIKRRKEWKNVKSYILVMRKSLNNGYCSIGDFVYVCVAQLMIFILPVSFVNYLVKVFYRKSR